MPSEFELIARHFTRPLHHTVLGVGDDGALMRPTPGMDLVVTTDMLAAGTHFFPDADPAALGWKALAVNLSDLAAMGAQPRWAVVAAALPQADEAWVGAFADGLFAAAAAFAVDIVGGDTTRGPLNITPTLFGEVPPGAALRRDAAQAGDDLWVSGAPGLAALGLAHLQGRVVLEAASREACLAALHRPQPRVALGLALRGIATSAIDVSDGLLADLGHVLDASALSATIDFERLPTAARRACSDETLARDSLLGGGDDYELLFSAPSGRRAQIASLAAPLGVALSRIGTLRAGSVGAVSLLDAAGRVISQTVRGYDHFA